MAHSAAWLVSEKAHPLQVKPTDSYTPGANEILIKNHALAINPIEPTLQTHAIFPLRYPTILGGDVAGEVLEVGSAVTRFKSGDRVLGHAVGLATQQPQHNGFQTHTGLGDLTTLIPDGMKYEEAVVLPAAFSTASCGLFQQAPYLNLDYPSEPKRELNGKVVLVCGGSSSNFEYVKALGASQVFEYNGSSFEDGLVAALKGVKRTSGKGSIATTIGGVESPSEEIKVAMIHGFLPKDSVVGKAVYEGFLEKALAARTNTSAPRPMVFGKGLENVQGAIDRLSKGVSAEKVVVLL